MTLYDTHAHLDDPVFTADLPAVIARAEAAGVKRIITIGTDLESSRRAVALAEAHSGLFAVVGWHPGEAMRAPDDFRAELRTLAVHPKVVAVGEIGLDYYRLPSASGGTAATDAEVKARQAAVFQQQLEVAADLGLNCVVHQRHSLEDTLRLMRPFVGRVRGQFHCFVDDAAALERVLTDGHVVSFTGIVTFRNATTARQALATVPADRFMLETDSPYLAPVPHRGHRCEPAFVADTATAAAAARNLSPVELGARTSATAHRFFPKLT